MPDWRASVRVAVFAGTFPAISETFVIDHIAGLIDRGFEVDIFAARPALNVLHHAKVECYGLIDRTTYFRSWHGSRVRTALNLFATLPHIALERNPIVRALPVLSYGGGWAKYARGLVRMASMADAFRHGPRSYDVIHCHFGQVGLNALALRDSGLLRGPIVTAFHGHDVTMYPRIHGQRIYDPLFKRTEMILPASDDIGRRLIEVGCPSAKVRTVHMGIDVATFAASRAPRAIGQPLALLSVARLVEKKGLRFAIDAVSRLRQSGAEVRYTIVGSGPLRAALAAQIEALDLSDCVFLVGSQTQEAVIEALRASDVFLAPSVTTAAGDHEACVVSIMEAMAARLPVIASRHGGIPELVEDGLTGFLIDEGDVGALAGHLQALVDHPECYAILGDQALRKVSEAFSLDRELDAVVEVYKSVAKSYRVR